MVGGALPAACELIFGKQPVATRDRFIRLWCNHIGLDASPTAIKQHVTRFKQAERRGVVSGLPDWMETPPPT